MALFLKLIFCMTLPQYEQIHPAHVELENSAPEHSENIDATAADEQRPMLSPVLGPLSHTDSDGEEDEFEEIIVDDKSATINAIDDEHKTEATIDVLFDAGQHAPLPSIKERPVTAGKKRVVVGNDGVFANLAAKPETSSSNAALARSNAGSAEDGEQRDRSTGAQENPPPYQSVGDDAVPSYEDPVSINIPGLARLGHSSDEVTGETFNGIEIGHPTTFFFCTMVTVMFQIIGFFACNILSRTHAGRLGARTGLGLVLLQFGMASPALDDEHTGSSSTVGNILSMVFMIIGWFLVMQGITEYLRIRRFSRLVTSMAAGASGASAAAATPTENTNAEENV